MTVKQAIKVLKKHNNWRRGGRGSQQDPKIIGEAIDVAIVMIAVKLARENFKHKRDNLVDLAGYTEILYRIKEEGILKQKC